MNIPKTFVGWVKILAAGFVLAMVASWTASQCRYWRVDKHPDVIEGEVDHGAPVAGPTSDRPTVTESLPIARPALTRAEVLAEMKRVGLELAPRAATPGRSTGEPGSAPSPAPGAPDALQEAVQEFPIFFGKERFGPGPAGDLVDVSAWQLEPGGKVQLEGEWHDYTPPVAATCPPIAGGFFRNEGRWEKEIGAGLLGTEDGIGPGGSVSVVFRGPSTGHANWGARGLVAGGKIGEKTTGFILATGKVSF